MTGDSAYVVVRASMTIKVRGKEVTQSGAVSPWRSTGSSEDGDSVLGPGAKGREAANARSGQRLTAVLVGQEKFMPEIDDFQHIVPTRAPALTGRYEILF
jgi:hypothetical protein